ncbi:MAG: molybdopterin molybdotransferase MoeA [Desulfuromonadales bacterium]|nr:molybdopterin molybdotransferase MoeA [Desulfuromonadales bacterium]
MAESFASASRLILETVSLLPTELVALSEASGRVLAQDIHAPADLPLWNNSAMDGFALNAADCESPVPLIIDGYLPAGCSAIGMTVKPGTAVRIMTGAPTPEACAAIVPIEETEETDGKLIIKGKIRLGRHIRMRGEDIRKGDLTLTAGTLLRPPEINVLATFGMPFIEVYRRVRVAILSTGDELVEPGDSVGPGQIVNSNAYSLAAAVRDIGGIPCLLGIARDSRESLMEKLNDSRDADVLVTTAGISMGDLDLVNDVLEEFGVRRLFSKINIKPGKPTAFGTHQGRPIFSLPGNPVSSMVIFEMLVRPALLKMIGHQQLFRARVQAVFAGSHMKKKGRLEFYRVRVFSDGRQLIAESSGDQNTAILRTSLRANGIAVLPEAQGTVDAGDKVDVVLFSEVEPT